METIRKYHFTKGFFGTNGVTKKTGFTTPDASEAMVKKIAMEQCQEKYILCDESKFGEVSSVTLLRLQVQNRYRSDAGRIPGLWKYYSHIIRTEYNKIGIPE